MSPLSIAARAALTPNYLEAITNSGGLRVEVLSVTLQLSLQLGPVVPLYVRISD